MKPFGFISRLLDPRRPVGLAAVWWIAGVTLALDQASKLAVVSWISDGRARVLIPNFLNLAYANNTGAAFSMFTGHTGVLTLVSLAVSIAIVVWAIRLGPGERGLRPALGLILGGAVGNLVDRAYLGHVIDFIQAHWFWKHFWPTFNIADSAICVGVAILMLAIFRATDASAPAGEPAQREEGRAPDPRHR